MNERVAIVVDRSARPTPEVQTAAHLEIEDVWKASPVEPKAADEPAQAVFCPERSQ